MPAVVAGDREAADDGESEVESGAVPRIESAGELHRESAAQEPARCRKRRERLADENRDDVPEQEDTQPGRNAGRMALDRYGAPLTEPGSDP